MTTIRVWKEWKEIASHADVTSHAFLPHERLGNRPSYEDYAKRGWEGDREEESRKKGERGGRWRIFVVRATLKKKDHRILRWYLETKFTWAELFKDGLRQPRVSARFEFRFESLISISVLILFVYKLMIESSKYNRENYPRKCFWTQEKETRVKFNPRLSANRPSNNWAQIRRKVLAAMNMHDIFLQKEHF